MCGDGCRRMMGRITTVVEKEIPMTTQLISSEAVTPSRTGPSWRLARAGAGSTLLAVVLVACTWWVADAATGGLIVDPGSGVRDVGVVATIGSTIVGGASGTGLAALARRFGRRPRRAFLVVCGIGLAC
jgi:hypothetical protein